MSKTFLKVITVVISITTSAIAQPSSSVLNNFGRAQTILNDVYAELNYNNNISAVRMQLEGSYQHVGNYEVPYATREFKMVSKINYNYNNQTLQRRDTFSKIGDEQIVSQYTIDKKSIKVIEAGAEVTTTLTQTEKYIYESAIFCPNVFLRLVLKNAAANTFISSDEKYHIIRHNNTVGGIYYIYIDAKSYYVTKIDQPKYDAIEGDYFISTHYENYDLQDGYQIPGKVKIYKDSTLQYNLRVDVKELMPDEYISTERLSKKEVGEWLHIIPLPEWNTRAVIADLKEELVVFDPPHSPEAGYALLDNIKKAWPNKQIKYCVISHHHPNHIGGIRPFIEEGVTIVTTKSNKAYIDAIATNKHLFNDDVRKRKRVDPVYLFVNNFKQELKVGDRLVVVYPMGNASDHTDEYLVTYVPNDKILIEGDLLSTWDMSQASNVKRKKALMQFIEANKLRVNKIIQTWPLEKTAHTIDYEQIDPDANKGLLKGSKKLMDAITK